MNEMIVPIPEDREVKVRSVKLNHQFRLNLQAQKEFVEIVQKTVVKRINQLLVKEIIKEIVDQNQKKLK